MRLGAGLVVAALMLGACEPAADSSDTAPTATTPPGARPIDDVVVLDGDSLRASLDGEPIEIRLIGINAPENDECWSDEARDALTGLVALGDPTIVARGTDQYGRVLAYLFTGGEGANRFLVASGHAIALATDHELRADFLAAEEEAADLERGLWSGSACGDPPTDHGVRIWAVTADAPGRDDRNPNGEFVAITNEGPPIELTGWVLRDESSVHRFSFPDGFVLDTGQIVTVRSGCGTDTDTELYWCADGTVWTNTGDTVLLLGSGGGVVERVRYAG